MSVLPSLLDPAQSGPPVDPSGEEGRSLLRRELLGSEYRQDDFLRRVLEAIDRFITGGIETAAGIGPLSLLAAMLIAVLLVVAIGWLVARTRTSARSARPATGVVVEDHTVSAREWHDRAVAALAEGRPRDAVVDGFRALAVRAVERHVLDDLPGSTAHEVAASLGDLRPDRRPELALAADVFDAVLYGDHDATEEQARAVLALDEPVGGRR